MRSSRRVADVLQAEEVVHGRGQRRAALLAEVRVVIVVHRVQVAARLAQLEARGQRLLVPDRQDHLVDDVLRALVVDERPRPELGDRQEARTGEKLICRSWHAAPG